MRKLFPIQYWLCWLGAAAFFVAIFPYALASNPEAMPAYVVFCVLLNAISTVLFRTIVFRIWVKRFYSDSFKVYAWFLAVAAFCHLVFMQMNPIGGICIALTVLLWAYMALIWWKEWKQRRQEP